MLTKRACLLFACAALACGSRSEMDVDLLDAAIDATSAPRGSGIDPSPRDAGRDSGRPRPRDAGRIDSGSLPDASAFDAGDLCPPSVPSGACTNIGAVCTYPSAGAQCTCFDQRQCGGCATKRCQDLLAVCGKAADGCGGILECGTCPAGQTCTAPVGGGTCVGPDAGCVRRTCAELGAVCGIVDDGCGGLMDCGDCYWSCNTLAPPCPIEEVTAGGSCTSPGTTCSYTRWTVGCCVYGYQCTGGAWQEVSKMCPL